MIIFTAEKPSVAKDYKRYLQVSSEKHDGYIEGYSPVLKKEVVITWAVGHLITLSYPEVYNPDYAKWKIEDLPILPEQYKYEIIKNVSHQFSVVKKLYHRADVDAIYYAGDAGREGLYIQLLIRQMAGVKSGIMERVVWADSLTEREFLKAVESAKDISTYTLKGKAAYMRAIEDYAVGINFSRVLSCKYGRAFNDRIGSSKWVSIAVGRVMSVVLGMIVQREREIREFVETPFYKISAYAPFEAQWKAIPPSVYAESPLLYSEVGFKKKSDAQMLKNTLDMAPQLKVIDVKVSEEKKGAPLLFNLAEIQFFCSKKYKISPDDTLAVIQSLYEKKLVTYPRTDARVLSTAVAEEIHFNLNGLAKLGYKKDFVMRIAQNGWHKKLAASPYVNDAKITDHYAIIPTGHAQGVNDLSELERKIFFDIIDRFLCIFYPPTVFTKAEVVLKHSLEEQFYGTEKTIKELGYLEIMDEHDDVKANELASVVIGDVLPATFEIKEGKTTSPKRYSSGSLVLAMENAGKMIEEEELREQIKGDGIGTSATRAEIIKKLISIEYIALNKKTQIITPTYIGECVYDILVQNMPALLKPEMTASWEKGLSDIEDGTVEATNYRQKLEQYIRDEVENVKKSGDINYTMEAPKSAERIPCPICKKGYIKENKKGFGCSEFRNGCNFSIWKSIAGKTISLAQVKKLVAGEKTSVIKGFKKKDGGTFDAALEYKDGKIGFVFPKRKE